MQLIHRVQIKYSFSVRIQPRWDVLLQRSKVMHRRLWVTAGATAANPRNSVRLRAVISSRLAETDNLKSSLNRKPEAVNMVDAGGKVSAIMRFVHADLWLLQFLLTGSSLVRLIT